jgi:hypothetical protein
MCILVNDGTQVFLYAEFQALAIAKVWAGKADFPGPIELRRRYDEMVKYRGEYGKGFHFLNPKEYEGGCLFKKRIFKLSLVSSLLGIEIFLSVGAMRYFQGWLNADAVKYGGRMVSSSSIYFLKYFFFKIMADTSYVVMFRLIAFPSAYFFNMIYFPPL